MAAEYEVNIKINTQEIERELKKVDKAVNSIGKSRGGKKQPVLALPSTEMLNATARKIQSLDKVNRKIELRQREINKQTRDQALNIDTLVKTQEKRARLLNKINEMEAKGLNLSKLRKQLAKATTEQSNRRFGSADKEFRILEKSIRLEQSKLRILKEQRKGFPSSPLRGTPTMMGSPAQIAAAGRQAVSPIGGKVDIAGSPAQMERIRKLEAASIRASKKTHFEELKLIQKRQKLQLDNNDKLLRDDRKRLADFDRDFAKSIADRQKMLQGVARAGIKPDSVFGPLRQLGQASMVAGANEAKLLAGRFRAPSSPLTARPVTRASAAQAAQQVEELVRARAALEKRATDDAAAYKMRADKRVHRAQLGLDQIEYKNKIDDIVELTNLQIKEGERAGRAFDKELKRRASVSSSGLTGQTSPIRGGIFQKGSPNQKRFEGVALGAGFPLLFGGGAGSVLGGGLGGLTGSFGAQIALSAIGQQIDQFVASVAAVGTALTSASGTVEMFREKNLFSSDAVKEHAFELEKQGKMQELATLLTKDLASQIGKNAVESFQLLGGETKEFLKTINLLFTAVQGFVAEPLAKLLGAINTVLGGVSTEMQFKNLRGSLTGNAAAEFERIFLEARGTRKLTGRDLRTARQKGLPTTVPGLPTTAAMQKALKDPRTAKLRQTIDVTGQTTLDDTLGLKPPVDRKAKEAARVADITRRAQERLQIMQQEGGLAKELKKLDFERAAALDKINKLESATTEERLEAADATNKLFDARKGEAIGKALGEDLQKAIKLKEEAIKLKEAQEDVLRPLEDQKKLLEGKLKGNEEEVRLQLKIERILRSVEGLNEKDVEDAVRKNAALEEQVKQVERLEKLYQQVGSAIENSIVDGIMGAIDGTQTLQETVAGLLKDIGKMFLQFAVRGLLQSTGLPLFAAEGAYVSGPTSAVVGEGGESEYIIPESKMRESMARYSRGARGSAVIPDSGASGTSGEGGGTVVAAPIDVRYTVERINSVDYVTADQFQAGMRQAASQGAKQGEQQTLKRLQMSGSTRKRLGL